MQYMFHDNIFPLRDPCFIWSFKIASNLANVFIIAKNFPYHHRHQMQVSHDLCAPVMQFFVPHTILLHCLEYHFQNVNITFMVRFSFFVMICLSWVFKSLLKRLYHFACPLMVLGTFMLNSFF